MKKILHNKRPKGLYFRNIQRVEPVKFSRHGFTNSESPNTKISRNLLTQFSPNQKNLELGIGEMMSGTDFEK